MQTSTISHNRQSTIGSRTRNNNIMQRSPSSKTSKAGLEHDLAALRQRAMLKNAALLSTTSIQTATTAATEDSFETNSVTVREGEQQVQPERRIRFDNTVKVRVFRSHLEWSMETKANYWSPRMTNKELVQSVYEITDAYDEDCDDDSVGEISEADSYNIPSADPSSSTNEDSSSSYSSAAEAPTKMDLHDRILQSHHIACAIAAKADSKMIVSIMKDPSAFAHFFDHSGVNGQTFRGLERYVSPTYCEKRKENIGLARSQVVQMSNANYTCEDISSEYQKMSHTTSILARLRGHADSQA